MKLMDLINQQQGAESVTAYTPEGHCFQAERISGEEVNAFTQRLQAMGRICEELAVLKTGFTTDVPSPRGMEGKEALMIFNVQLLLSFLDDFDSLTDDKTQLMYARIFSYMMNLTMGLQTMMREQEVVTENQQGQKMSKEEVEEMFNNCKSSDFGSN